jgi:hypothetical protein
MVANFLGQLGVFLTFVRAVALPRAVGVRVGDIGHQAAGGAAVDHEETLRPRREGRVEACFGQTVWLRLISWEGKEITGDHR